MFQIRRNIQGKELHKIAKVIQWNFKRNFANTYARAFQYTDSVHGENKYKLRLAMDNSLVPSNKLNDPSETIDLLESSGIYDGDVYDNVRFKDFNDRF